SVSSNPKPCNNQTIDELPQTLPSFHSTFLSEAENPFTLDSTPTYVDESPNVFNPPPQPLVYSCEFYGKDAYYGHYCTPQAPFIYSEPCYNQDFNFPQDFQNVPQQYPCCDVCGVTHEVHQYDNIISGLPPFFAITPNEPVLSTKEPDNALNEVIKSSVEDLIPIPSESEGIPDHLCDVSFHDNSLPLDISKYQFEDFFDDDQSCFDEDVLEKIVSKPLIEEEIIPMKIDQHPDNAESDLLESLQFVSANSDAESESFSPSPILVKDSDSLMEEIDLFCTPDYPMPPGIVDDDYDSERDILILKDLPSNNTLSFAEKESFHFDIPLFSRPPAKPPDEQSYLGCSFVPLLSPLINPSMGGLRYRLNPCYAIKECSSCGTLYTRDCVCSKGNVEDKILVPKPPKNYARCGHPVDGPNRQGCALLRQELEENLVTQSQDFQNIFESSNDNTNIVNAPQEPFVIKQDHGSFVDKIIFDLNRAPDSPHLYTISPNQFRCFHCKDMLGDDAHIGYNCQPKVSVISNPEPCKDETIDELPQTLPSFHPTFHSEAASPFTCVSTPNYVDKSPNVFNPPP
nr:hypothetical protein [Tanacetum cinerariifolium]